MDRQKAIQDAIDAVERKFRCYICMVDLDHDILSLFPRLDSVHFSEACNTIKKNRQNHIRCMSIDIHQSFSYAEQHHSVFCKICPFGVMEIVAPVICDRKVRALLFSGVFCPRRGEWDILKVPPVHDSICSATLLSPISDADLSGLGSIMQMLADSISEYAEEHLNVREETDLFDLKKQMENVVQQNFKTPFGLSEMAERFDYSLPYLSVLIKKLFGKNLTTILTEKRIENACMLLARSSYKIKDIALYSGFRDPAQFHRVFRRYCLMQPKQYRTLRRKGLIHSEILAAAKKTAENKRIRRASGLPRKTIFRLK